MLDIYSIFHFVTKFCQTLLERFSDEDLLPDVILTFTLFKIKEFLN